MAALFWKEKFYHILNQTFIDALLLEDPNNEPTLEDAQEHFKNVTGILADNSLDLLRRNLSNYLRAAFIFSRSFDKNPFQLDELQLEIIKGDVEGIRALAYLM